MTLAGLWHGSTLMFVFWGAIHGLGLVIHKSLKGLLDMIPDKWPVRFIGWLVTFCYVAAAWVYFRSPDMETCGDIFVRIATDFDLAYLQPFVEARPMWTALVVGSLMVCGLRESFYKRMQMHYVMLPWVVKLLLLIMVVQLVVEFHTNNVQPFIYYQF